MLNFPAVVALFSLLVMWAAVRVGIFWHKRRPLKEEERDDFSVVQAASLTLLGLIIGFTFSMATSRYDMRKNYEEDEANAIGTEYVRAGLLPAADAATVRSQLAKYLDLRISFYRTRDENALRQIDADTDQLQLQMWSAVQAAAATQPTPIVALVVSGMNDVLNSQGYTQAAWWNRIPSSAWGLMVAIAMCGNLLVGYGTRNIRASMLFALPVIISISFLLIADIDSPRHGLIHVRPQNLESLSQSLPH